MFSLLCNTYFLGENGRLQARFRENVKPTNGKSFPVKPLPSWDKPLYFSKWLTGSGLSGSNSSKCDVSVAPSKLGTYGGTTKRKKKQTNKQNNEEFWECQRLCAEFFSQTSQRLRALKWVQLVGWQNFGKCSVKYIKENFKFSYRVKPDIAPGLPVLFLTCDVVCLENELLTLHWTYNSVSCSSLCRWRIDGMSVLHIQSLLGCLCTDSKSNPWHSYWPAHLWKIAWNSGNKKAKNKKNNKINNIQSAF